MAVLDAARQLLVEQGAAGMRMELIAARSGVHRSSLYRRWKTPAGIVADLASQISTNLTPPDTGSLEKDVLALAERLATLLDGDGAALVQSLLAWRDPEVRAVLDHFWQARIHDVERILQRHGLDADPHLTIRLMAGPIHYQALVEGCTPAPSTVAAAVRAAMTALTVDANPTDDT